MTRYIIPRIRLRQALGFAAVAVTLFETSWAQHAAGEGGEGDIYGWRARQVWRELHDDARAAGRSNAGPTTAIKNILLGPPFAPPPVEPIVPPHNHTHHKSGKVIPCCGVDWWFYVTTCAMLVTFAAIMSGLTIALMSIDSLNLSIVKSSGSDVERLYAEAISPLMHNRHLLLVTLLLGNAAAAESLPIVLKHVTSTKYAILLSVILLLTFSEIIPQALFSKHKLAIGAFLSRFVAFLMTIFYPIAFPIAKVLDCVLGKDHPTIFRRAELKEMTKAHLQTEDGHGGTLSMDEVRILNGTLDMADKTAFTAMRPLGAYIFYCFFKSTCLMWPQ